MIYTCRGAQAYKVRRDTPVGGCGRGCKQARVHCIEARIREVEKAVGNVREGFPGKLPGAKCSRRVVTKGLRVEVLPVSQAANCRALAELDLELTAVCALYD